MKKQSRLIWWLLAIVPLFFIACDDDETVMEETLLEASVELITFSKSGGEQSITISTNATAWVASSPVEGDWLTLTSIGSQLIVKTTQNTQSTDRKSFILINSGTAATKVEVVQGAGDVALFLTPELTEFTTAGGEKRIDVIGTTNFTVEKEEAANWLTIDYTPGSDFFVVKAAAYNGNDPRTTKVTVAAKNTVKELTVKQIGEDRVLLPFFGKQGTSDLLHLMDFEEQRGSKLITLPTYFDPAYYFITKNPNFPQIGYATSEQGDYDQAITATTNLELEDDIYKALEAKGFKAQDGVYTHIEYPYTVTVTKENTGILISAVYTPIQDKEYATFSKLPLVDPQMKWTGFAPVFKAGTLSGDIIPWEETNGGIINPSGSSESSKYVAFSLSEELVAEGAVERGYWLSLDEGSEDLRTARALFTKLDLAYWTPGGDKYYFTKEFIKLLADNGFVFVSNMQDYVVYGRADVEGRGFMDIYALRVVQFSDAFDGQRVVDIQSYKTTDETAQSSMASILTNPSKLTQLLNEVAERLKESQRRDPYQTRK